MSIQEARESLPMVSVNTVFGLLTGKVTGGEDSATVTVEGFGQWQFSWATIARAITNHHPLQA